MIYENIFVISLEEIYWFFLESSFTLITKRFIITGVPQIVRILGSQGIVLHIAKIALSGDWFSTGCGSHFENPTNFKILKESLVVQKQALHQQKALDLEPEGQGRGIIMRAWQCHWSQRNEKPPRARKKSTKYTFHGGKAWLPPDDATPTFSMANYSWDQGLSADVKFVTVLAMVLSEYWKKLEDCFFVNFIIL